MQARLTPALSCACVLYLEADRDFRLREGQALGLGHGAAGDHPFDDIKPAAQMRVLAECLAPPLVG